MQYLPTSQMQKQIKKLLTQIFGLDEVRLVLSYLRDGVSPGSFSYAVYLVIDSINNAHLLLKALAFEPDIDPEDRNHIFWLYLHTSKHYSIEETLKTAEEYLKKYPYACGDEVLMGTKESIESGDLTPIGRL